MNISVKTGHTWRWSARYSHVFIALIIAITYCETAGAQDWYFGPELRVGGEYDDNAALATRSDEEIELTGYLADGLLNIEYNSPATRLFFAPRLRSARYSDNPEFDFDDQFARWDFSHDTKSSTLRFRGRYSRQSTRTAERQDADLDIDDPDDFQEDSTGRVEIEGRRQKYNLRPSWQFRPSDISSITAQLNYTIVDYENTLAIGGLTDYTDARLRLTYERQISRRNVGLLTATGRNYDAATALEDKAGYGVAIGVIRNLTPLSNFRAVVGIENTDKTAGDEDQSYVFDFSLTQRLELITLVAQYKRSINASGAGNLSSRDAINIRFTRRLSDRLSAGLGVRAYTTTALSDIPNFNERDYVQLRSRFTWNFSSAFAVEADYRYTFTRRTSLSEGANSNSVILWFMYRPGSGPQ